MHIHISGRGVVLPLPLRRRIEAKVAKVARLLPKVAEARVVLARERHRHLAEVTLQAKRATLRAEGAAGDFHAAAESALDALGQQARRRKDRIQVRKSRPSRRGTPPAKRPGGGEAADEAPALVVRRVAAKPMSVDEAVEQLRVRRDPWLVFTEASSHAIGVLRRRPDGRLELVLPAD